MPETKDDDEEFKGNYDPTYLVLAKKFEVEPLEVPLNKARAFVATTDAVNDFFIRADNRGRLFISDDSVRRRFSIKHILYNGRLTIFFSPVDDTLQTGDSFEFELGLVSDSMPEPLAQSVGVKLVPEEEIKQKRKSKSKPKPKPEDEPKRGLPPYVLLTKDGRDVLGQSSQPWPEDFSELDGGRITGEDDRPIYEINVDNAYHLRYRRRAKADAARDLISQKYVTGMRLFLLGFENSRKNVAAALAAENGNTRFDDVIDDFRTIAARGAASVVLWLTDQLPKVIDLPEDTVE